MAPHYIIRKASPNDTGSIAKAIISAGGRFLPWLFGEDFNSIINECTNSEGCSFSWFNAVVCEYNDKVVGVVISYPSEKEAEMDAGLSVILKKHYNFLKFMTFLRRARKAVKYFTKPPSSYYILAIAVLKEYRGEGIAEKLLSYVEKEARKGGYTSIALEVESYNYSALRAYQKFGFHKRREVPISKFSRKLAKEKGASMYLLRKEL